VVAQPPVFGVRRLVAAFGRRQNAKDRGEPAAAAPQSKRTLVLGLLGAVLLWAALPPLDLGLLGWLAPVPWVLLIRRCRLPGRRPYGALWLAGLIFWLAALHWLRLPHWATSFGWLALSLYFPCYLPVFVGLSRLAVHRLRVPVILAAPVVWTGLELARGHLLTGMTMACLGHTQHAWITMIQISDLAGAYGVSFVVMFAAACLARALPADDHRWKLWPLAAAAGVLAATWLYGHFRTSGDYTMPGGRVALIQGSIDTKMKSDANARERIFDEYFELSQQALQQAKQPPNAAKAELVVWPETMFRSTLVTALPGAARPADFDCTDAEFAEWLPLAVSRSCVPLGVTARALATPLLFGVDSNEFGPGSVVKIYNSATFVAADGTVLGRYDKMHPVMFGEYVPFAKQFPLLYHLTPLHISVTAGEKPAMFAVGRLRVSPNICYESVLSHVIRGQVNALQAAGKEPNVLVNLTNDGWFWGSSELDMHLVCGVFRAVECRKPFLVAANTGFSAWIDGDGRVLAQGPRRDTAFLLADVRLDQRRSWYLKYGDWPAGICLVFCGAMAIVGWRRRRLARAEMQIAKCKMQIAK
jgi:apolipoprotein N-acyltransferase